MVAIKSKFIPVTKWKELNTKQTNSNVVVVVIPMREEIMQQWKENMASFERGNKKDNIKFHTSRINDIQQLGPYEYRN